MRRSIVMCLVCCALTGPACSDHKTQPTADPSAGASASAKAVGDVSATAEASLADASVADASLVDASISASHGGSLVAVGDHHVEIKLFQNGDVEAWVVDARGKAIADPQAVKLKLVGKGGADNAVAMSWSEPMARFTGSADAKLTGGDVIVELDVGGKSANGKLENVVMLVGPEFGGTMMVAGKHGVEVRADADGSIEAAVKTAAGVPVKGGLALSAKVQGEGDAMHAIKLTYDARLGRFRGKAKAGAKLFAGPIEILIGGKVVGKLPRLALCAKASHGGQLVMAGDYSVEVIAKEDLVSAFVADANALAHAKGDLNLKFQAGAGKLIDLEWHAPSASYRAKLAAGLDLDVQPFRVFIRSGGKVAVGGRVCGKGAANASVKLIAPSVNVAAKAKANAKASAKAKAGISIPKPKVDVKTSASKSGKVGGKAGISVNIK